MRKVVAAATNRRRTSGQRTILFVDEIHHFNKAQQDILLPDVESGNLRLIGATTYNPFFYVNSALVSRSQVFQLESLGVEELEELIERALADEERGLGKHRVKMDAGRETPPREAERRRRPEMSQRARDRRPDHAA